MAVMGCRSSTSDTVEDASVDAQGALDASTDASTDDSGDDSGDSGSDAGVDSGLPLVEDGHLLWAKRLCSSDVQSMAVAAYSDRSIMVSGFFYPSVTFNYGEPDEITLTSEAENGWGIFMALYESDGALRWARMEYLDAESMALRNDDTLLVTGDRSVIAMFDDNGVKDWFKPSCDGWPRAIKAFEDGSSIVVGTFDEYAYFGQGEINEASYEPYCPYYIPKSDSDGCSYYFIARYNPDGTLAWSKYGGDGYDGADSAAALSDGSSLVSGSLREAYFLIRYDKTGQIIWGKNGFGLKSGVPDLAAFADDSFVMVGSYDGEIVVDLSASSPTNLEPVGETDSFIASFDAEGHFKWLKQTVNADISEVEVLPDGTCMVAGSIRGTAIFNAGESQETTIDAPGDWQVFLAKYREDGTLVWVTHAPTTEKSTVSDLALLNDGSSVIIGQFDGYITFGPGEANEIRLVGGAIGRMYIARFAP